MHYAAGEGHLDILQYLIEKKGGDLVHLTANDGNTPLHTACHNGHLCAKLLERGAVVDQKDNVRTAPRHPPSRHRSAAPADGAIARVLSLLAGRPHPAPLGV